MMFTGSSDLQAGAETIHQDGIKLRSRAPAQLLQCLGRCARGYIRAMRSHHIEGISDCYYARTERNSLGLQTGGVAVTIPALMVMAYQWDCPLEHLDLADNLRSVCRVLLDLLEFLPCQTGCFL